MDEGGARGGDQGGVRRAGSDGGARTPACLNDEITVDVLPSAAGHGGDDLKAHIVERDIDGVAVKVLDLEGPLKSKEVPRPKDQADSEAIRPALDILKRG